MLKVEIGVKKDEAKIEAQGSSLEIGSEILYLIANIYKSLARNDLGAATAYRMLIQRAAADELGPVWNGSVGGEGIEMCFKVPRKEES